MQARFPGTGERGGHSHGGVAVCSPRADPVAQGPNGEASAHRRTRRRRKAQSDIDTLGPFIKGLADLGYVQDRDYALTALYDGGDGPPLWPAFAKKLVALAPDDSRDHRQRRGRCPERDQDDSILANPLGVAQIPTLIGDMARPSGNVTGLLTDFHSSLTGKHTAILRWI